MEFTINQALQKAMEAHNSGQLQEAAQLYSVILKAQPDHPDANHNLGVLSVNDGKLTGAISYFKAALEANPSIAQFWISYIDALIKLDKLADAKAVLDQATHNGAKGEGFDKLEQRLLEAGQGLPAAKTKLSEILPEQRNILDRLTLAQAFRLAKKKERSGAAEKAKHIYQDILLNFPKNKRAKDGLKSLDFGSDKTTPKLQDPPQDQVNLLINFYSQGQLQQARKHADALLKQFPASANLFNIQGVILRGLGQIELSIDCYKKALAIKPDYAEAYNNMGNALKEQGNLEAAMAVYKKAVSIKPDYAEAYNNIGIFLKEQGKLEKAIEAYKKALVIKPDYEIAYNNMGNAFKEQGKLEAAMDVYKKALAIKPDYAEACNNVGVTLQEEGKLEAAIDAYKKAIFIKPDYADAYYNTGNAFKEQGKLEAAVEAYKKALAIKPDYAEACNNMGVTLQEEGKLEAAISAYKKALVIKPDYAEAHRHLSRVTKYDCDTTHISEVQLLLQRVDLSDADRCRLLYTYAKMQDDLGNFRTAFDSYVAGGKLRKKLLGYSFTQDERIFGRIKQTAPQFRDALPSVDCESITPIPIFILGMPRSGTTLVEQIISSHSAVTGAGELGFVTQFGATLAAGTTAPNSALVSTFRERYLTNLTRRAEGRAFVTDKMPDNFKYISLICAAFPEAKIIHVQRQPKATCWSNFKHYFVTEGLGYSYSLPDTVRYYALYKDLMRFWNQLYTDRIYNLDYDEITEDQEPQTRRLIEHLGLTWEDACLAPEQNKRSVKTASDQQVRRKVYKGSSQAWKNYKSFLEGLFDALET